MSFIQSTFITQISRWDTKKWLESWFCTLLVFLYDLFQQWFDPSLNKLVSEIKLIFCTWRHWFKICCRSNSIFHVSVMIVILLFFKHLIEFLLHVSIYISNVNFKSVSLNDLICQRSIFLKSSSYSIVEFLKCDICSLRKACMNVKCFRRSFFHEKKWDICNRTIINKVLKWIRPA